MGAQRQYGGRSLARPAMALALAVPLCALATLRTEAKQPGALHCYKAICHRVLTIDETRALVGTDRTLSASYYAGCESDRFNRCGLTSSGARFEPDEPDNAASPVFPDGTILLVRNPRTGRALVVRVNNAGPYYPSRQLDLSRAAAQRLGLVADGVAPLDVRVLKTPRAEDTRYKRLRTYVPVAGDIGTHESLEAAAVALPSIMSRALALARQVAPDVSLRPSLEIHPASPVTPLATPSTEQTGDTIASVPASPPLPAVREHREIILSSAGPDGAVLAFEPTPAIVAAAEAIASVARRRARAGVTPFPAATMLPLGDIVELIGSMHRSIARAAAWARRAARAPLGPPPRT